MNAQRMAARGVPFSQVSAGHLLHYRLCFNKRADSKSGVAYANIAPAPGERVEGVLYRLDLPDSINTMDAFEGCPIRYSREVMRIQSPENATVLAAWIYVANPAYIASGLLPESQYLDHLREGAQWHSVAYRKMLAAQPVIDGPVLSTSSSRSLIYND